MYPIRFEPIYQDYVWGGDRIAKKYRRTPKGGRKAESWEISDRDEGMSVVANGEYKGMTLRELMEKLGEELLGVGKKGERFPLLLKIIDAKEHLSVQVHPDESRAEKLNGEPKTEMWVALEPGSVYAGLKKGISEKELLDAIEKKKTEEVLEKIDLHSYEAVYIPGGRVHAICGGTLLYEIQQNSNTTYRLYDWGRQRELHLKEALASIHWGDHKEAKATPHHMESDLHHQMILLVDSPYFTVMKVDIFDEWHVSATHQSYHIFFCMEGEGEIRVDGNSEPLHAGMTYLVPAAASKKEIIGKCQVLWIRQR